jgi:hypothetical protein
MSETAVDPSSASDLEGAPLAAETLPPAVQKLLTAATPMRTMAARGIAPLRPGELLTAIYQLSFDPEESVRAASQAAPGALPDKVLAPALAEPLPAPVIHFFAARTPSDRDSVLEPILLNPMTGDQTFVMLGSRLRERELEVMFHNEARILRCPAILQAMYFNPQARMSSLNRTIELCARNNVRVEGIPSFDDVAKSIAQDPGATDPAVADTFTALLASAEAAPATALDGPGEGEGADGAAQAEPEPIKKAGGVIDFTKLKLFEKIRLATLGNEYCRKNLMRDPNRMVALAAIRSPRITDSEIVGAAGNRSISEDVIRYIAGQRDLTKTYQVKLNLVQNPKCPVALSLKFLPFLQAEDLKHVARSKNVPSALATGARRLIQNRQKSE